jgi:ankyrin repeat protein
MRRILLIPMLLAGCGLRPSLPPLIQAAREGRIDRIPVLVRQGADPNQQAGVNGWTPLMHAIHKNQKGSIIALLDAGADVNGRSSDGSTPLMMAAGYGYTDLVNVLLDRGADPHLEMSDGSNALTFAVLGANDIDRFTVTDCQGPTVKTLLAHAPDLSIKRTEKVLRSIAAAKLKSCAGLAKLVGNRFP